MKVGSEISEALTRVRGEIQSACNRAGRSAAEVRLLLVTKKVRPDLIKEAYEMGVRDFGENRVQEWLEKKPELPPDIRWHLIGHLQTNKVKHCLTGFQLIHSVDSFKLARTMDRQAGSQNRVIDYLVQVNTTGKAGQYGFSIDRVPSFVREVIGFQHLRPRGLMMIGPLTDDENEVRSSFRSLRLLRDELIRTFPQCGWQYLSMGMSHDFKIAVEEGASLIRIGTAVFGRRKTE